MVNPADFEIGFSFFLVYQVVKASFLTSLSLSLELLKKKHYRLFPKSIPSMTHSPSLWSLDDLEKEAKVVN